MQLITRVDVSDPGSCEVNADCVLLLELDDGRRLPLLTDRGWGETQLWSQTTLAELEPVARMVVGPDIPFGDLTEDDMAHGHWLTLARPSPEPECGSQCRGPGKAAAPGRVHPRSPSPRGGKSQLAGILRTRRGLLASRHERVSGERKFSGVAGMGLLPSAHATSRCSVC